MATVQQLADYFTWHTEVGRGDCQVEIDMSSQLCVWQICQMVTIASPSPDRIFDALKKVVMIDVVMETI